MSNAIDHYYAKKIAHWNVRETERTDGRASVPLSGDTLILARAYLELVAENERLRSENNRLEDRLREVEHYNE